MSLSTRALALSLFVTSIAGQWMYPTGFGQYGDRGDQNPEIWFNTNGNTGGTTSTYYPNGLSSFDLRKNYRLASNARIAHASLASAAFVFFFPVGAIAVRTLPGRLALVIHVLCQAFAYLVFTVAFIIGVWMSLYVSSPDFKIIRLYHPIIGIVIFCLLFLQPITGLFHHLGYKKHGTRTAVSHFHISLGRLLITFGMINGGLGLMLAANASKGQIIAYGVIAGVMWLLWISISIMSEVKRGKRQPAGVRHEGGVTEKDAVDRTVTSGTNGTNGTSGTNGHHTTANGAGAPPNGEKYV